MKLRELIAGQVIDAGRGRVTQNEIVEFAERYDPQWFHVDPDRAIASSWKGLIASGLLTCCVAMRLAVDAVLRDSDAIGSPGIEQVKWPNPMRAGDEFALRITVLESRPSRSRPVGILRWRWVLTNQRHEEVLDLVATVLFGMPSGSQS